MLPAEKILNVKSALFSEKTYDRAWFMCGMYCCMMCLCEEVFHR